MARAAATGSALAFRVNMAAASGLGDGHGHESLIMLSAAQVTASEPEPRRAGGLESHRQCWHGTLSTLEALNLPVNRRRCQCSCTGRIMIQWNIELTEAFRAGEPVPRLRSRRLTFCYHDYVRPSDDPAHVKTAGHHA